jgi:hypothetical protein
VVLLGESCKAGQVGGHCLSCLLGPAGHLPAITTQVPAQVLASGRGPITPSSCRPAPG